MLAHPVRRLTGFGLFGAPLCSTTTSRLAARAPSASVDPCASQQLPREFLTEVPASSSPAILADCVEHVVDVMLFDVGFGLRAATVDLTVSAVRARPSFIDRPPHMHDHQR